VMRELACEEEQSAAARKELDATARTESSIGADLSKAAEERALFISGKSAAAFVCHHQALRQCRAESHSGCCFCGVRAVDRAFSSILCRDDLSKRFTLS